MSPSFLERRDGSEAESVFEQWATTHGVQFVTYGFRRPPIDQFYKVPAFVSHTPDFLIHREGKHLLLETKGTGADGILKIKLSDIESFTQWNAIMSLWFFIWNSHKRAIALISFDELLTLLYRDDVTVGEFEPSVHYYAIPHKILTWRPHEPNRRS